MAIAPPSTSPDRTQDRLWHDVFLPEDVKDVRTDVRAAVAEHLAPTAREIGRQLETPDAFPWEAFRGLASAGVFAYPFEGEHGAGLTHRTLGTCIATEEIAYESSSLAGVYDGQCILVAQTLRWAPDHVKAELLPKLISGEQVFSFATTEPDASSDLTPSALKTVATRTDDGFTVTGRKRWITNSIVADWVCMLCRDGEQDACTMLLIPLKDNPGVTIGPPDTKMGHHGQITADIVLENVHVPHEHCLGQPGRGLGVALGSLAAGRVGIAAAGVGVAQAALDLAVQRVRERKLFGKLIGEMQHWQYRLAAHATEIECARSLYQKAAMRMDLGDRSGEPEASMAKSYATRLANDVARDALQVHGGYGFARQMGATGEQYRLEEIYRDAKILEIFEGANEVLQWVIARHLIGRDVTG